MYLKSILFSPSSVTLAVTPDEPDSPNDPGEPDRPNEPDSLTETDSPDRPDNPSMQPAMVWWRVPMSIFRATAT